MATVTKSDRRVRWAMRPGDDRSLRRHRESKTLFDVETDPGEPLPVGTSSEERERRLEEVVLTTWAALVAGHPVECPVCGGPLTAAEGCSRCGSRLS